MSSVKKARPAPRSPFRPDLLQQHVVLITGGGSGIGLELSHQLGLHGAKVAIMGRREAVLQKAVQFMKGDGIDALHVSGDVRKEEDCKRAVEEVVHRFGQLDVLVNCAAGKSAPSAPPRLVRTVSGGMTADTVDVLCRAVPCAAVSCVLRRI